MTHETFPHTTYPSSLRAPRRVATEGKQSRGPRSSVQTARNDACVCVANIRTYNICRTTARPDIRLTGAIYQGIRRCRTRPAPLSPRRIPPANAGQGNRLICAAAPSPLLSRITRANYGGPGL